MAVGEKGESMMAVGEKGEPKIAWGITGAGHFLSSCLELMLNCKNADFFLSQAAQEVCQFYGWYDQLKASGKSLFLDIGASSPPVTKLYTGKYDLVVIAPVTSNSIAKMVNGIADNLITNLFAHAGKCRIPTLLLPCDTKTELTSVTPKGSRVSVYVREIDRQNIERLVGWDYVTLMHSPEQLKSYLKKLYLG